MWKKQGAIVAEAEYAGMRVIEERPWDQTAWALLCDVGAARPFEQRNEIWSRF